jgi:MazG family protein
VKKVETFEDLVTLMDRLRGSDGCPWDREQTYETLRGYLLEECYEVVDAIDAADPGSLREELGDLLFQIVFLSRLASEQGHFRASDVIRGIGAKMIRRHPHVFGDDRLAGSEAVLRRWEEIKRAEKEEAAEEAAAPASVLDGVPRALPALLKAERLGRKAARVGFDWTDARSVFEKVEEELGELRRAVAEEAGAASAEELGDLLFAVAMLARKLDLDAERCLERANSKFERRFRALENDLRSDGLRPEEADQERLEQAWARTKAEEERFRIGGPPAV